MINVNIFKQIDLHVYVHILFLFAWQCSLLIIKIKILFLVYMNNALGKTHIKKNGFFSGRTTKRGEGGNPPDH